MSQKTDRVDNEVLEQLPVQESRAVSIADLCRFGSKVGTVRAALKRLVEVGKAERTWDGNGRFGRYLYWGKR